MAIAIKKLIIRDTVLFLCLMRIISKVHYSGEYSGIIYKILEKMEKGDL